MHCDVIKKKGVKQCLPSAATIMRSEDKCWECPAYLAAKHNENLYDDNDNEFEFADDKYIAKMEKEEGIFLRY